MPSSIITNLNLREKNRYYTKKGTTRMLPLLLNDAKQIPLFQISHQDDKYLLDNPNAEWFSILYKFPWENYREYAALYYDALYGFNIKEERKRRGGKKAVKQLESKEESKQRLLFDRTTMQAQAEEKAIIYEQENPELEILEMQVDATSISPGVVPERKGGKKAKCFFSLFKSFIGVSLIGLEAEPERVEMLLSSNPSFVRACGFAQKHTLDEYCHLHVPGLRKLEQFDQIMREYGLWDKIKLEEVRCNLISGVIKKEEELVGDTTHYIAYSGFEVVKYVDDKGKEQKKSQSKVTKNCRCKDQENCGHEWELSDDGAGTIVKSSNRIYWGHKASIIGYPSQGIPLDIVALRDGATHDGESLYPHIEKVFSGIPEIKAKIKRVIYDSACDDQDLRDQFAKDFKIKLKTSLNPRRKKEAVDNLPRGVSRITPYGIPICIGDYEMEYKGMRIGEKKYIYQSPVDSRGAAVCFSCPNQKNCCPNSVTGRTINVSFDLLPHINHEDPPMAKRFKAIMSRRTSVERMIKRIKCDMSDDRLSKRGNDSFQAYLDKTMIAYHMLLRN